MPAKAKKKLACKLLLDAVMLICVALLFNKRAISMAYHEISALVLFGAFLLHLALNRAWIAGVSHKFFARGTDGRLRLCYATDALLLLCFVLIIVSGALISKVVFSFGVRGGVWKTLHYFCAAVSLLLLGVHLGLHYGFLAALCRRALPKAALRRTLGIVLGVALLLFGVYSFATTSYFQWLTMPFAARSTTHDAPPLAQADAARPAENAPGQAPGDVGGPNAAGAPQAGQGFPSGNGAGAGAGGKGAGRDGRGDAGGSAASAAKTVLSFASIAFVFAALTAGIERLLSKKRRVPPAPDPEIGELELFEPEDAAPEA